MDAVIHNAGIYREPSRGATPDGHAKVLAVNTLAPYLLTKLMERPGRVFTREQLLAGVWGNEVYIDERTVDVHVGRLRKALNRGRAVDPIRTVRGSGYALDDRFAKRQ